MSLRQLYRQLPPILRNRYIVTIIAFAIWMLFFDSNTLFSHWRMAGEIKQLRSQEKYYEQEIETAKKNLNDFMTKSQTLERFAREQYLMKKPDEDIFIISREKK